MNDNSRNTEIEPSCSKKLKLNSSVNDIDKSFSCSKCPYKAARKKLLNLHMRSHSIEKPFLCDLCPSKFSRKDNFNIHMILHEICGEKTYFVIYAHLNLLIKKVYISIKETIYNHLQMKFVHQVFLKKTFWMFIFDHIQEKSLIHVVYVPLQLLGKTI